MSLLLYLGMSGAWTVGSMAIMWFKYPHVLLKTMLRVLLYMCGLRRKFVNAGPYRYCYAERGKLNKNKASLVLVHGFSASKDMWINIVKNLPKDTHIIVPDLPGHGETTIPPSGDQIDLPQISDRLYELICAIGLEKHPFHIAGTSMGGAIVALYASKYQHTLKCVTLICPAIPTPIENEFIREVRAGHCRLIPDSVETMQKMLDSCLYKKPQFSKQFLKGALLLRLPKNGFLHRLFLEISKELDGNLIDDITEKLTAPTQLLWGENDELVHISGVEMLKEKLPNCVRSDIMEKCGHSVNMDRPGLVAKYLQAFRQDYA